MENDIWKTIIEVVTLVLSLCVPVFIIMFKRILKDADKALQERDNKIKKLFEIVDDFRACLTEKAKEISSIRTDIEWLKSSIEKMNGKGPSG